MRDRLRVVVVGGGISGLAAAWRLSLRRPDVDITLVEAAARLGGKLITEARDGFLVEAAADGFLARKPPALDWARTLGLESDLVEPRPEHRFSQVWWEGRLHALPEGFSGLVPADPAGLRNTTLLTPEGAHRAAAEAQVPPRPSDLEEESVEAFFVRRYGSEAFERLMEPLLAGIVAGDASLLSAPAAFPQLTALEAAGQSLTMGLAATPRTGREGPAFRSFRGGMAALPQALEAALQEAGVGLVVGQPVIAIESSGFGLTVRTAASAFEADAVIVALPPRSAAPLVATVAPLAAEVLGTWPTSSVANLNLAFDEAELPHLPRGSGLVAPRAGRTVFSATTWSSRKWPGRAPDGRLLVRVYFGGARDPEGWRRSESELTEAALELLASFHQGRRPVPLWTRLFRWKDAFAQPNLGHALRHERLAAGLVPSLFLVGGYFAGVGIPDCLARADAAAGAVDRFLATGDIEA